MADVKIERGREFTAEEFVASARSYLGTPYRDGGRRKGRGCDCIGLPLLAARDIGGLAGEVTGYSNTPKGRSAETAAGLYMEVLADGEELQRVARESYEQAFPFGAVALFWVQDRTNPQHFAVIGRHALDATIPTMIHAHQSVGKVVEASLSSFWVRRAVKLYRLPGMTL